MDERRRVKVLRKGSTQILRIPRGYELPGNEAVLRKQGSCLVIEPVRSKSLLTVLSRLRPLKEKFSPIKDKPPGRADI